VGQRRFARIVGGDLPNAEIHAALKAPVGNAGMFVAPTHFSPMGETPNVVRIALLKLTPKPLLLSHAYALRLASPLEFIWPEEHFRR
jgi:hypothetical protein